MIKPYEIINVIRRTLVNVDKRLINHGERVAFIANKIVNVSPNCFGLDEQKLFLLCTLHDIGAYKTEEINDMLQFELNNNPNHAIYGYLFLKSIPIIGDYAEGILYHHTDYRSICNVNSNYREYAEIIYLADKIDILIYQNADLDIIKKQNSNDFNPKFTKAFFEAEKELCIIKRINSGNFIDDVESKIASFDIFEDDVMEYLKMIVYAIDFRSELTITHTANTISISRVLGELLMLSKTDLEKIYYGAFLHDIGKIAIPYEILENPGKLDFDEMEIMKTHVSKTEEIIKGIVDDDICNIAVRHHEKLNGKGYPYGLEDKDLNILERIVAIADVLSALSGKRSYKEAFSKEKTISILSSMRDNYELDGKVCNIAINKFDYILKIVNETNNNVMNLYKNIQKEYKFLQENL